MSRVNDDEVENIQLRPTRSLTQVATFTLRMPIDGKYRYARHFPPRVGVPLETPWRRVATTLTRSHYNRS